jgi:excinuclease UvrABC helicase subunit UvrB
VKQERESEAKKQEDLEGTIVRLKQNMRAQANHHEVNTKRMRDKITKLENDLEESL